jgi:hypothetical protein
MTEKFRLENVYNQLYETKHQNGAWEAINDGLAIVAAIVAVCAVPLTAGTSAAAAATILAASLGVSDNPSWKAKPRISK